MFHKKFYYVPAVFVHTLSDNGPDALPVPTEYEFFDRKSCQDYISYNNLNAEWPQGYPVPATVGACNPKCFCDIYRRQVVKYRFRRPRRAIKLLFAGFERMRRSAAEDASEVGVIRSRQDIPKGYRLAALFNFIRSLT